MKTILTLVILVTLYGGVTAQTITQEERQKSMDMLLTSMGKLRTLTAHLNEKQLNYHPADDRWSIRDNVEHLLKSEKLVFDIITRCLETQSDAQQKSDFADDEFVRLLSTRGERKFNAPEKLRPGDEVIKFNKLFKELEDVRRNSVSFIQRTDKDLRHHFSRSPIGNLDAYQWTLQLSAHMLRHIEQVEEILSSDTFPK